MRAFAGLWFDGKEFNLCGPWDDYYETVEKLSDIAGNCPQHVVTLPDSPEASRDEDARAVVRLVIGCGFTDERTGMAHCESIGRRVIAFARIAQENAAKKFPKESR